MCYVYFTTLKKKAYGRLRGDWSCSGNLALRLFRIDGGLWRSRGSAPGLCSASQVASVPHPWHRQDRPCSPHQSREGQGPSTWAGTGAGRGGLCPVPYTPACRPCRPRTTRPPATPISTAYLFWCWCGSQAEEISTEPGGSQDVVPWERVINAHSQAPP